MQPIDSVPLAPSLPPTGPSRPEPGGAAFREVLASGLEGASRIARAVLPGGPLVGVALTGLSRLVQPDAAGGTATDLGSQLEESRHFNLQYLALQQEMARESRAYSAVSNIMKARHEAALRAINNIR